jgi:hypothetical protein
MTPECVFFVKSWGRPDHICVESCSLTGKSCFCEGHLAYLTCTRRTFALSYEAKQSKYKHVDPIVKVVCSEDSLQPPLPSTYLPSFR